MIELFLVKSFWAISLIRVAYKHSLLESEVFFLLDSITENSMKVSLPENISFVLKLIVNRVSPELNEIVYTKPCLFENIKPELIRGVRLIKN